MSPADSSDLDQKLDEFRALAVTRRQRRLRANVATVACAIDVVTFVLVVAHAHGLVRQAFGLAFCLIVPGWALVGPLRLHAAAVEAGLVIGASLASLVVVAQLAITFHAWNLATIDAVVCVACLPSLVWQAAERRGTRAST